MRDQAQIVTSIYPSCFWLEIYSSINYNVCVNVGVLAWSAVDSGFEPRYGQTEDYELNWYLLLLCSPRSIKK